MRRAVQSSPCCVSLGCVPCFDGDGEEVRKKGVPAGCCERERVNFLWWVVLEDEGKEKKGPKKERKVKEVWGALKL